MARDVIALMTDADPCSFDIDIDVILPDGADAVVAEAGRAGERANKARRDEREAQGVAVRALLDQGLSIRDASRVLGVSPQRVSQLASTNVDQSAA